MATFLFIMIVLALLALVVTLVVFTLSQRKMCIRDSAATTPPAPSAAESRCGKTAAGIATQPFRSDAVRPAPVPSNDADAARPTPRTG